jgi:leucyl aminopeptidase
MKVRHVEADLVTYDTPILAIGVEEGGDASGGGLAAVDAALDGAITRVIESGDMAGELGDEVLLYGGDSGPQRVLLLGLGKLERIDHEAARRMAGRAVRAAERMRITELTISMDAFSRLDEASGAQAVAEGATMAAWRYRELKTDEEPTSVTAVHVIGGPSPDATAAAVDAGATIGAAANFARTLQSRPGNVATPTHLADEAVRMGVEVGLDVTVFDETRMLKEGMHAILAVSRGSVEEARFIIMEHRGGSEGDAPLVLVGKGLTFDAGGISLKPPKGMEEMKYDMSGGAAVIGALQAIAELGVPANVIGIVPSSENLPSGTAVKPGDVIDTLGGKSVEVINTDAEGRLILADALAYAVGLSPAAMIDCATLTGAVVIALGHHAAAVMGNDEGLMDELISAGESSGERCWPLPLWDDYREQLDSEAADMMNVGGRPGGAITAGLFLKEFVGDVAWAHLDVAGTAYGDGKLSYQRKGAYGFPTRLLVQWVRSRVG